MTPVDFHDDDTLSSRGSLKTSHLILIAALAISVAAILVYSWQRRRGGPQEGPPKGVVTVPEGSRAVTLFFADPEDQALVTETRLVAIGKEFAEQVGQVVRALLDGPEENGVRAVPAGTRLLDVFYDPDEATVYLDLSSELVAGHPGGSAAEYFTIASILRTVSQNFPEVRAVQFLVEGLQIGTIAGHIDAYGPFPVSEWR